MNATIDSRAKPSFVVWKGVRLGAMQRFAGVSPAFRRSEGGASAPHLAMSLFNKGPYCIDRSGREKSPEIKKGCRCQIDCAIVCSTIFVGLLGHWDSLFWGSLRKTHSTARHFGYTYCGSDPVP
jgi:hypothetical protein